MTTFEVDDVVPAAVGPWAEPLERQVTGALWMAPEPKTRVLPTGGTHPLLAAVHLAFAEHRPLVLSPDAVWLTLAQGLAQHVRLNSETLRPRFVRHAGKKVLTVQVDGPPADEERIQHVLSSFRGLLSHELGPGLPRLLSCDFSTSTDVERMAGDVVLMDVMSPYFDYAVECICGIPRVTLLGTPEDWRAIRRRIDVMAELDLEWWTSSLIPIADELIRASEGQPDRALWQELYKPRQAYGPERATGWVARLFPYVGSAGLYDARNPLLETSHAELMAAAEDEDLTGAGLALKDVPGGLASVPMELLVTSTGKRATWAIEGGVLAVEVTADGGLMPRAGVVVREGHVSVTAVVARMRQAHEVTPRTEGSGYQGNAELNALYDQLSAARLFPKTRPWRLRHFKGHDVVHIPVGGGETTAVRAVVDLPDGGVLALRIAGGGRPLCVVWLRADLLARDKEHEGDAGVPDEDVPFRHHLRSKTPASDVPVVGHSLVELLARALDTGGDTDFRILGTLEEQLEDWEKVR
jgi:hypothetical protein